MGRAGCPSRSLNNDSIDIRNLRHNPRNLAQPRPAERLRLQGFRLNMET